jgi:phasin
MNEQARRFAEKNTNAAHESFEGGTSATEDATRNAEKSYSSALTGVRDLNLTLIKMAYANTEAVFELAHEIASAEALSDLPTIWAEHARRQFELMTSQNRELTNLGQKLAGRTTEPLEMR